MKTATAIDRYIGTVSIPTGVLSIADPIRTLGCLFGGGGGLPAPFGACGIDETPDALTCADYAACP